MNDKKGTVSSFDGAAIDVAMRRVVAEIRDGLRHGYFEYAVTCEVVGQGRRRLLLSAGKTYQFVLSAEQCESRS